MRIYEDTVLTEDEALILGGDDLAAMANVQPAALTAYWSMDHPIDTTIDYYYGPDQTSVPTSGHGNGTQQTYQREYLNGDWSVAANRIQAKQFKYDVRGRMTQVFIDERGRGLPSKIEGYIYDDAGIRVRGGSMVLLGDFDMSAIADVFDVDVINLALADKTQYEDLYGVDPDYVGDMDESGNFDAYDITPYEDFLANGFPVQWLWVPGAKTYINDPLNPTGYAQVIEEAVMVKGETEFQLSRAFTLGLDVIAQYDATTTDRLTFLYDSHGSTRALVDSGALVVRTFNYDAYGNAINFDASAALTSLLYSGEQFNINTGLSYLRARYYDPATGRFTRMDPFGGDIYSPLSLHRYLYGNGNPIFNTDPTGWVSVSEQLAVSSIRSYFASAYLGTAYGLDIVVEATISNKLLRDVLIERAVDLVFDPLEQVLVAFAAAGTLVEAGYRYLTGTEPPEGGYYALAPLVILSRVKGGVVNVASAAFEKNHLNQLAAFRDFGITRNNGVRLQLDGSTSTLGSEHYKFHQYMESFWDQYRPGGALAEGRTGPTLTDYNRALYDALNFVGLNPQEIGEAMRAAIHEQRFELGLSSHAIIHVPRSYNIPLRDRVPLRRLSRR